MDPWLDGYYGEAADQMAKGRRTKLRKMVANPQLTSLVIEKLKEAWSPEQIAGHLRVVSQTTDAVVSKISHETIYRYVYDKTGRALDLYRHLPTGRRRRRRRYDRKPRGLLIPQANTIAYRPDVINERQRLGDWECDLVQFRKEFGNANLTTIVERKTRLLVIVRNPSRHSEGVMKG
ncbi:MAG: IS30 family transposase, partial [Hyphomonadaceae bacterium]